VHVKSLRPIHIFSLGCCAITAQAIFVREMMAFFSGTELVIGVLLAGWLFWLGLGGLLGGRVVLRRGRVDYALFAGITIFVAALLPVTTVCVRLGRGVIAKPPGVLPPLASALLFCVLILAPFGFAYGTIYNISSALWMRGTGGLRGGISRVYAWEAAGSVFGALLFSFVLVNHFSQFEAAVLVAFLLILSVTLYPIGGAFPYRRAAALFVAAFVAAAFSPTIDRRSIEAVYPGYRIVRFVSSRYGEIVVTARREVESVFASGARLFSWPEPERTEEVIDIPLLLSPAPRTVLLIGCSLGGGWEEAVKHPSVDRVDCVELDGRLFDLGVGGAKAAEEGRVRFIVADGRFFLRSTRERYDVVILNSPPPVNLQWNRFYTREFFAVAKRSLRPGGIFAFTHPSSENFLSAEQATVLRSIELTLESVFPRVTVLPGMTNHFIAGDAAVDPDEIVPRLKERRIDAPFVGEEYIPYRFSSERIEQLRSDLEHSRMARINTDARPVLTLEELVLEGSKMSSATVRGFRNILRIPPYLPGAALCALLAALFLAARASARAPLAVWVVGFASFLLQLLVLLGYQAFSGLLYHTIVLITALFMAGAALGAFRALARRAVGARELRLIHLGFIALACALSAWSLLAGRINPGLALGSAVFLLFSACGGFLTGSYYTIVVRTAYPESGSAVPAIFYAWDVLGACVAGIVGGVVFFPVMGLAGTAACIVLIHGLTAALVAGRW
jgi:spermidine synthase